MVVYLARTSSSEHSADVYEKWSEIVQTDIVRSHSVTDNPEKADLVLIVDVASDTDPLSWRLRTHPIWKKGYKADNPICSFPSLAPHRTLCGKGYLLSRILAAWCCVPASTTSTKLLQPK